MTQINCPNCDGQIEIPKQSSTVVCGYCNTTVNVKSGEILKENYFMRLQYDLDLATDKMYSWGTKQLGAPKNLEQSKVVESKLVFWPFWVVEVEAKANYTGIQKKPDFKGKDKQKNLSWNKISETLQMGVALWSKTFRNAGDNNTNNQGSLSPELFTLSKPIFPNPDVLLSEYGNLFLQDNRNRTKFPTTSDRFAWM